MRLTMFLLFEGFQPQNVTILLFSMKITFLPVKDDSYFRS